MSDTTPSGAPHDAPEAAAQGHAPRKIIITIGRQFGSGGRELGRRLAARLGIPYYDKELLSRAASNAGVAEEFVTGNDERSPRFLSSVMSFSMGFAPVTWYQNPSTISAESIYTSQSETIRRIADEGSCVIVGRSADYVLRGNPGLVSVFVHAPLESCVARIIARGDSLTPDKARRLAEKTNRLRASYYNFYTDRVWGHADSYDLCFDTSLLPIDDIAAVITDYISRRFA